MNRRNFCKALFWLAAANKVGLAHARRSSGTGYNYIDKSFRDLHQFASKNQIEPVQLINTKYKKFNTVCVGERHMEEYREFLHKNLKRIRCDSLGLEIEDYFNNNKGCINTKLFAAEYDRSDKKSKMKMVETALNCGKKVRCLDSRKKDREGNITRNIEKYLSEKMLVWYGSDHISKYDNNINKVPAFRRLLNKGVSASSILMITPSDNRVLSNAFFYSPLKYKNFGLEKIADIPERKYRYNMDIKSNFISFDSIIYYVDSSYRKLQ